MNGLTTVEQDMYKAAKDTQHTFAECIDHADDIYIVAVFQCANGSTLHGSHIKIERWQAIKLGCGTGVIAEVGELQHGLHGTNWRFDRGNSGDFRAPLQLVIKAVR